MNKIYIGFLQKTTSAAGTFALIILLVFLSFQYSFSQGNSIRKHTSFTTGLHMTPADADVASRDAAPPVIAYTPLANTCTVGNRVLTTTITDADGVPTTGPGRPVLYWKINAAIQAPVTGTFVSGNTFTFTFGAGAAPGSLVSYYIVAQDNAGNVIAKPSAGAGGYSLNPPAASTPPPTPEFYVVQATLAAGTYNVGVGQAYITITDAVNAYNNSCLSGAVTFVLTDAAYGSSEIFPITINNPAASSTNTLTIKPSAGVSPLIEGSAADAILKFNGADYITIDGSNSGGITRNLTISNINTGTVSTVIWIGSASASNGATRNTIKNCIISGSGAAGTNAAVMSSSGVSSGAPAETANTFNTIQNNLIHSAYQAVVLVGPTTGESNNIVISNALGSAQAAKKLGYRGLVLSNQTLFQASNNVIQGVVSTFGLGSDVEPTGGVIVSGLSSGGAIFANIISDIKNSVSVGWPAYGISLQSSSTAAGLKVYNNFIYGIVTTGNSNVALNGLGLAVLSGGGYGIYFNSINLFSNASATSVSAACYIGPNVTGTGALDIRNNIFSNRRTSGTNYAVYSSIPNPIIFSSINYNDYYSTSFLGYLASNRATIAAWQSATGMDGNSVAVNPIFVSTSDLHLQPISPLNDQGTNIAGITTDIDGATRAAIPDIGADDFTPPNCSSNLGGTATSDFSTVCTSGTVSLASTGFSYGLGIAYQWEKSTDNFATAGIAIPGETNPTSANPPTITTTTYYRLRVTCSAGSPSYSNVLTVTVYNPSILSVTNGSRCGPGTVSLSATGTAGTAIQWYSASTGGAPLYTGNPFTTSSLSTTTTYFAESVFLGSSGTVGKLAPNGPNVGSNTQYTSWDISFNVIQATKLLTIDVYPLASGENSTIDIYLGSRAETGGTLVASVPYTTNVSGGNTAQVITLNIPLPIGSYYMYATNGIPASGLTRDLTGGAYPYTSSDIVITGNGFLNTDFYMAYYRWRFSNGCSSAPRSPVTATVGLTATLAVNASPVNICAGSSSVLSVSSSNTGFVYTWTPGPLTGATQTVTPATTTTYTVNASDGLCTATGSVTVTVNPASTNVVISPAAITKCASAPPQLLSATGGDIAGVAILNEDFNGGATPGGWVLTNTSAGSGTNLTNKAWTLRPDGYVASGNTFHSNDNSPFYITRSDLSGGATKTILQTPGFSLAGYTSASLTFYHHMSQFNGDDSAIVEYATAAAGPWTRLRNFGSRGSSNNFRADTINLTAYVGVTTNYIRFRYATTLSGFFWAIDNVKVTGGNTGSPIKWSPLAGLFTDAAGTVAYTGVVSPTIYANPTTTTIYTATATPVNACEKTQTIEVTVRPLAAVFSGSTSVCPSGSAVISIALTGTGPWNLTYTDGTLPVTVTGITASPYLFTVNPLVTTTYSLTALSDIYCSATPSDISATNTAVVTVSATAFSTWIGTTTDWNSPINWCGGVPTATKDVVIPITANSPVITSVNAVAHDISIISGASITISSTGVLSFKGAFVNNGTLINDGTLVLNGSTSQAFPGGTTGTITRMNVLEVNNNAGVSFDKPLTITGMLKPTAGPVTLNNITVTLHSDTLATASVGALGASAAFNYTGSGKFSVERFITSASRTGWRFLSAPINGTQTINQAWMEGDAPGTYTANGYGMQIVGPGGTANGFDVATSTPSLKTYKASNNSWEPVVGGTFAPITTTQGYMAFIRGDRSSTTLGARSTTVLRVAGPIKTGTVGPVSTPTSSGFISVGNPYPSAISFANTTRVGLQNTYYLWDPKLGTYGGYQTFTGPSYTATPGGAGSSYTSNNDIESGQAFFVIASAGAAPHQITFTESAKVNGSHPVQRVNTADKSLRTQLSGTAGNASNLIDGVLVEFDPSYSNVIDDLDAPKLSNFGENLALAASGKLLSVERHAEVAENDTIFYELGQLRQQEYQFAFIPTGMYTPGLTAFLEDGYLHTRTLISLQDTQSVRFTVGADPESRLANRFRLVFRSLAPVPVMFTQVNAVRQEKDVNVSWKVSNEISIDRYEVERSFDGRSFSQIGITAALSNNGGDAHYLFPEKNASRGDIFYRIKSVGTGSYVKVSDIVKVKAIGGNGIITVSPNPVKGRTIGLNFQDVDAGVYNVKLVSSNGQVLLAKKLMHVIGNERILLTASSTLAQGMYSIDITSILTGEKTVFKIIVD